MTSPCRTPAAAPGPCGSTLIDHRADARIAIEPDRLQAEPEIAARDPAVRLELGGDALDRGGRDDEHAPARPEHRHAEGAAGGVERQPAFGDRAAATDRARCARRSRRRAATARPVLRSTRRRTRRRRPCSRDPTASASAPALRARVRSSIGCRSSRSIRRSATSVVGSRPTSVAATRSAAGQRDLDLAFVGQRLVGGDDQAGPPDESAGARAMRTHADDMRRRAGDGLRQRFREVDERRRFGGIRHERPPELPLNVRMLRRFAYCPCGQGR